MNNLLMEVENEIAVVTINRPKALNALNTETIVELNECLKEIEQEMTSKCYFNRCRTEILRSRC